MGTDDLARLLRQLRTERGLSQVALAGRAGLSRNFVAQIERGESLPTVATLARLASALGITSSELLGEGPPAAGTGAELVAVPLVSDRIAAGPPMLVADHVESLEPLPRQLLRGLGVDPARAVLVRLGPDQDSMADTIPPGATVLVDRSPVRQIVPRGVYAVREEAAGETGCSVKRLVLDSDSRVLILLSDNPAHLPRAIRLRAGLPLSEIVIGRVVWWAPPAPARR
ncbi:MAG TPA: XRE family transcriptional regulator [Thermoanaerobaculaceae bacterium]|nr:XRE family transcriptional regulator [Thermoanaerobaculaceae bacterium]HRS16298.1 XRE family transcriptional regulator [Thermoanaerobaculaceae bacterium]